MSRFLQPFSRKEQIKTEAKIAPLNALQVNWALDRPCGPHEVDKDSNLYYVLSCEESMVTIRLPDEIENQLQTLTEIEHKTKTEIIKTALSEYFEKHFHEKTPYALGKDLFGKYSSEENDLSTTYKDRLKQMLNEKYSH